ncbi:MAG: family 78 glycoside hydrolase catalytic domain [Salinivirgaceae bacterium]|jgi:alpha-L-rhamnosidase|nr:family 78 glycoside hydrolase catalytic domain [Salinivirgaceae bacterium]
MKRLIIIVLIWVGIQDTLFSQNMQPVFETSYVKPKSIVKKTEQSYFIDFGKTYFGTVVLKSKTSQTNSIVIHLGEKLASPDSIDRKPGGTIRYQRVIIKGIVSDKQFSVKLTPDERNTKPQAIALPDSFGVVMPFRYCEIENLEIPIEDIQIYQKEFHYQFNDDASYFNSSNPMLDRIYELCKHTIKATSFAGYYIDGDRERIPYEADAFINQLSHYAVDSVYSIARRTNEYFIDHCTWPTEWILHTALMYYYDYLYTNDLSSIEKYYENLKVKSLIALAREDGFISTKSDKLNQQLIEALGFDNRHESIKDIVDWPKGERDNYDFRDVNTVVNAFYYENLRIMSIIADKVGKPKDAEMFREKAERIKKTIQGKLIDSTTGLFIDGLGSKHSSLHANMFPLAFDLVPEKNIPTVINFIKSKGMACSVYGAQYLLEGLCKYGEEEYALSLVTDTIGDRNWFNMLRLGSSMTLEAWDAKYKSNLDWNHAWATAPLNIIVRYIWGITPEQPGFKHIKISPRLNSLSYSSIKVPSINGCIIADYESSIDRKQIYNIVLPKNTTAKFFIDTKPKTIRINNKKIDLIDQYILLENKKNRIELNF